MSDNLAAIGTNSKPGSPGHIPAAREGEYGEGLLDFENVRAFLWRQRYLLIGITALVLAIGLILTLLATPVYEARSTVRVNLENSQILEGQELSEAFVHVNEVDRYLATLGEVIGSRALALEVVDTLELQNNETVLGDLGDRTNADTPGAMEARRQAAASILSGTVQAEIPLGTRIIEIVYSSTDPALAAQIANTYARMFLLDGITEGQDANAYAREYLEEQIAETRDRLQVLEGSAVEYARNNRLIANPLGPVAGDDAGEGSGGSSLASSNLLRINEAFADARAARISAEQRWRAVERIPAAQLPEVQRNSSIQSLRTQLAEVNGRLSDLRERYREDYPEVRELTALSGSLQRGIDQAAGEIKAAIRNEFTIARRQEAALSQEVDRVASSTIDEQGRRVQYGLLEREADAMRSQLATLLDRFNQITSAANLRANNVTMLDEATVPRSPSSPNLPRNLLLALVAGLGLAGGLSVLRELMDDRLRTIDDVERKLGLPAFGQTPHVNEDIAGALDDNFSPIGEAYSSIRATVDYVTRSADAKVIQFTSGQPTEGKSTTCAALAMRYAAVGRKVLLVDMDVRRPAQARMFGHERPKVGLVDVLYSRASIESAMLPTSHDNLHLLVTGEAPSNPVEMMSSGLLPEFFEKARAQFDLVLVDSSPIIGIADAPLLSRHVDATVLIIEANRSSSRQTRSAIRRLRDMGANIVGVVLTKFRALDAGQAYSYQYQYYNYRAGDE